MSSDITVDRGSIQAVISNLNRYEGELRAALWVVTDVVSKKMEEWAKTNAIWTDQTSNARQGLKGNANWQSANILVCSMSHTMEYGKWLELAHERKYAILEKSINEYKNELMAAWNTLVRD